MTTFAAQPDTVARRLAALDVERAALAASIPAG